MNKLALYTGVDIPIPELELVVHQPSIKELSLLSSEDSFREAINVITIKKERYFKSPDILASISNFQLFSTILTNTENQEIKNTVFSLLIILFPNYQAMFSPSGGLVLSNIKEKKSVLIEDDKKFSVIQNVVKNIFKLDSSLAGNTKDYNPQGKKAQQIADKIMKARARIAAQKEHSSEPMFGKFISILSIGLGLDPLQIAEWTVPILYRQMERYQLYLEWDLDIKVRLAGGEPKKAAQDFMSDIS